MALKLPREFQLDASKFPKEPWAQDLVDKLNQFAREVVESFRSQPQWQYKVINLTTGVDPNASFPIDFEIDGIPSDLHVASVMGATIWSIESVAVVWTSLPNGQIRILNVSGLVPQAAQTIRFAYLLDR